MNGSTTRPKASRVPKNSWVQTEIGLLPETWPVRCLGDVFETQLGKMLSQKAHGGDAPKPYLRNKNVQWGSIDTSDMLEMDFSEREKAKFQLRHGDLLVCEGGVPGRAAIWNGTIEECYYQKALHRLRPRNGGMINQFMLHWLRFAFDLQNLYGVSGASSTIAHLPEAQLKSLPIPVPPPNEQRNIAAVLGLVQQAIEQQELLITLTTELKKALMHKLFTQGLRGELQKETEIGPVLQSWEVATLESLVSQRIVDGVHKTPTYISSGIRFITAKDIIDNAVCFDGCRYISLEEHEQLTSRIKPRRGDVLLTKVGTVGNVALVDFDEEFSYFVQLALMRPNLDLVDASFLYWCLQCDAVQLEISSSAPQSTMKFIGTQKIAKLRVPVPPISEQRDIARSLEAVRSKLIVIRRRRESLRELDRALLHALMTAQIHADELELNHLKGEKCDVPLSD